MRLPLVELPPAEPELNQAERVFDELRRAVKREVYGNIEDKMAAVDLELTSVPRCLLRIRRLVGWAWIGNTLNQLPQQFTAPS